MKEHSRYEMVRYEFRIETPRVQAIEAIWWYRFDGATKHFKEAAYERYKQYGVKLEDIEIKEVDATAEYKDKIVIDGKVLKGS